MSTLTSPGEICAFVSDLGIKKAKASTSALLLLGVLAGAFIAFAAQGSSMAAFNLLAEPGTYGLGRCLAGTVFPTGLMLVLLAGGELFTGNTLMVVSLAQGRIGLPAMLRNWGLVYFGNLLGSLLIAHMIVASGLLGSGGGLLGGVTVKIASGKVSLSFLAAFYLGILCNWLVCLAVWLCFGAADMAGKILGVFCPIWLFVTSGFEHSIANMYYIPAGIMAKGTAAWAAASGLSPEKLDALSWGAFIVKNLVPVTLGNIVGGSLFVGMAYWFAYLRNGPAAKA